MCENPVSHAFVAGQDDAGERLDRFLAARLPDLSRSRVKDLVKAGHARCEAAKIVEPNYRVKPGDAIDISVPPPEPATPSPENIPLNVLYEDNALIVIDKPAGLVVHPAAGNWTGTLVNALIAHCGDTLSGIGGVRRPGIVHRLDKDTSGVMVAAKTDAAHQGLSQQFADHGREGDLERRYTALVWGAPRPARGVIDAALGRSSDARVKQAVLREGGRHAVTHYETAEVFSGAARDGLAARVICRLETGRTHQVRVHLAHIGHPLLGDAQYGSGFATKTSLLGDNARAALAALGRHALHATHLAFRHPENGEILRFDSPLPQAMANLTNALRTEPERGRTL